MSVLSIHCCCCNLNENCFWTQSQRKLRFPPLLNVIKTSKDTSQLLNYHIKPPSTHFPVCRLHFSLGSVHPISMHPWHLPEVISHVGWGSSHPKLLVQPRKSFFRGNVLEKNAWQILSIFGKVLLDNLWFWVIREWNLCVPERHDVIFIFPATIEK